MPNPTRQQSGVTARPVGWLRTHLRVLRDGPQQRDAQHLLHVLDAHHVVLRVSE